MVAVAQLEERPVVGGMVGGSSPLGDAQKDIFEHLLAFTLSPAYDEAKALIEAILPASRGSREAGRAA